MVFGNLVKVIEESGLPLKEIVKDGLSEMGIKCFPAVRLYDDNRNATLNWSINMKFWQVLDTCQKDDCNSTVMSDLVKGELERRRLVYISKLKKARKSFPWISVCLRKLSRERLSADQTVLVLTFISCLALIMENWYVDFSHLQRLEKTLPITQYRMKSLEIQSNLLMNNFNAFKLFRLHFSIPRKMEIKAFEQKDTQKQTPVETIYEQHVVPEDSRVIDDDVGDQDIVQRPVSCLPANNLNFKTRWCMEELETLHEINASRVGKTLLQMYDIFKKKCTEHNIPVRTFKAFKRKLDKI